MRGFQQQGNILLWELKYEKLMIEAWGRDSLRLRAAFGREPVTFEGMRSREVYLPAGC